MCGVFKAELLHRERVQTSYNINVNLFGQKGVPIRLCYALHYDGFVSTKDEKLHTRTTKDRIFEHLTQYNVGMEKSKDKTNLYFIGQLKVNG